MKYKKERLIYFTAFLLLFVIETLIALYIHDGIIRPYIGDALVVILIYCGVRTIFPVGIRLLPLYIFAFASAVEILQYFDIVAILGLEGNAFLRTVIGSTFSFTDILCYFFGCLVVGGVEYFRK